MTPIEKLINVCNRIIKGDRLKDIHLVIELEETVKEYESAPKEGCDMCRKKPNKGDSFDESCASCCHFYAIHWEAK